MLFDLVLYAAQILFQGRSLQRDKVDKDHDKNRRAQYRQQPNQNKT